MVKCVREILRVALLGAVGAHKVFLRIEICELGGDGLGAKES
jgi:hypothetical protein